MTNTDVGPQVVFGPAPLRSFYGYLLGRTLQVYNSLWTDTVGNEPTSPQFAVIEAVALWPGSDQRRVGEIAFLDKSSTMDIVRRLSRNQWITRERSTRDTRRDVLGLTSAAGLALEQLRPSVQRVQEQLLSVLTAREQERFLGELAAVARVDLNAERLSTTQSSGVLLRRARQVHTALLAEELGSGITGAQLATIITLARSPGINQRVLGEAAALDRSTTADIVSRLDRRGWLKRRRDPDDGRRQVLELTIIGDKAARDLAPRVTRVQVLALEPLRTDQTAGFLRGLAKLAHVREV